MLNFPKQPNIIFLDFDGVICTPRACLATGNTGGQYSYLDPMACLLIRRLCEECNSRLVISSSWRNDYDDNGNAIRDILHAACPNLGKYMFVGERGQKWRTGNHNGTAFNKHGRGKEIYRWLQDFDGEFNNFVILDDDSDMEPLMDSFVKCDCYDGIGFMQYMNAEKILMKGFSIESDNSGKSDDT